MEVLMNQKNQLTLREVTNLMDPMIVVSMMTQNQTLTQVLIPTQAMMILKNLVRPMIHQSRVMQLRTPMMMPKRVMIKRKVLKGG